MQPPSLPLPDKPSIAVMPFANMSGDPAQEYFSDGLTDDLITDALPTLAIVRDRPPLGLHLQGQSGEGARGEQGVRSAVCLRGQCAIKRTSRCGSTPSWSMPPRATICGRSATTGRCKDIFALQDEIVQKIVTDAETPVLLERGRDLSAQNHGQPGGV